ncbi:DUF2279 domain-containing protein [soil metagenome]
MLFITKYLLFLLLAFAVVPASAQNDSIQIKQTLVDTTSNKLDVCGFAYQPVFSKKRFALVTGTEAILYVSSIVGLNELWYKDYPRSNFHSFNDNQEWLQMDKVGHLTSAYYVGRVGIRLLKWSGVERKKAIWYGGMLGFAYQNTIEVLDGYSSEWGFSWGDFTANTGGTLLCIGQELAWHEQRIVLKYSFQQIDYAKFRPNVLGKNLQENMLKDYNGQTYWLSVNPASFMVSSTKFPKWLNIAFGYGANGMTGGDFNPPYIDEKGFQIYHERYRQYYLSFDVDLTRIKTKSKFLNTVFYSIGFLKIPAPAIEFSEKGVKVSLLGF